jgi:hypothetical protein
LEGEIKGVRVHTGATTQAILVRIKFKCSSLIHGGLMIFFTANELVLQTSIYQCFSKISYFYSFSKRCSEILLEKHNISQIFSKVKIYCTSSNSCFTTVLRN